MVMIICRPALTSDNASDSPTGNKTLPHNFFTISKNGKLISRFPRNIINRAGVINIPATLLVTALHNEQATFPPEVDVRTTHMLIVVGRHVSINSPSRSGRGSRKLLLNDPSAFVNGRPMQKGHTTNVANCIAMFNDTFDIASESSERRKLNPESRKMVATPY